MEHDTTIRLPNGFETPATVTYEYLTGGAVLWTRITPETPLRAGETVLGEPDTITDYEKKGNRSVAYMLSSIVDLWIAESGWTDGQTEGAKSHD